MLSEILRGIVEPIEAEVHSRPSAAEFEMAYQARVAIDRIKFAIQHTEQFALPYGLMREASLHLLDALERLEALDRLTASRAPGKRRCQNSSSPSSCHNSHTQPAPKVRGRRNSKPVSFTWMLSSTS
jgi:hypothetical protein